MAFGLSAGAVAAIGAVAGAGIGAIASNKAANSQSSAANAAAAQQQQIYDQNQTNLQPYMQIGNQASSRLSDLLGSSGNTGTAGYGSLTSNFTPQDYLNNQDPGYQFQLQQGNEALQNSLAAQNGVLSGGALKDLIGYNQGMAAQGYQNAFNRFQTQQGNVYQRLLGLGQLGENAAAGAGSTSAAIGGNQASAIIGAGNAEAAGQIGSANSISSGLNNATGYYYLNSLLKTPGGGVNSSDPYGYLSGSDPIAAFQS